MLPMTISHASKPTSQNSMALILPLASEADRARLPPH
jgi:hypothetical protein